jgi:hypothetical protein
MVKALEAQSDITVSKDWHLGTVEAFVIIPGKPSVCIFRAIQKGHNQPWIVTMMRGLLTRN